MSNAVDIALRLENEKLAKDLARAERDFAKLKGKVSKDAEGMGAAFSSAIGKMAVPAAVIAGFVQLGQMVIQTSKEIADLNDKATSLGISFQALQKLEFAAIMSGTDIDRVTAAIAKMQTALGNAAEKGEYVDNVFSRIGLSLEELMQLTPDQQFASVADAISRIENPAERASASMAIFGRGFKDIVPLLEGGKEGLREFEKQAEQMGVMLDGDTRQRMARFDDSVEVLKLQLRAAKAEGFGPLVDFLNNEFAKAMDSSVPLMQRIIDKLMLLNPLVASVTSARLLLGLDTPNVREAPSVTSAPERAENAAAARAAAQAAYDAEEKAFRDFNQKLGENDRKFAEQRKKEAEARAKTLAAAAAKAAKEAFVADWGSLAQLMAEFGTEDEKESYEYWSKRGEIILAGLKAGLTANSEEVTTLLGQLDKARAREQEEETFLYWERRGEIILEGLKAGLQAGSPEVQAALDALDKLSTGAGDERTLDKAMDGIDEAGRKLDELEQKAMAIADPIIALFDAIISGSMTAEEAVKNLIKQLLIAIARAAILNALGVGTGSFGSTLGSILTGGSGMGSGMGMGGNNVRIYNYGQAAGGVMASTSSDGSLDIVIGQVAKALSTGGNTLDATLRRTYGLNRIGI